MLVGSEYEMMVGSEYEMLAGALACDVGGSTSMRCWQEHLHTMLVGALAYDVGRCTEKLLFWRPCVVSVKGSGRTVYSVADA